MPAQRYFIESDISIGQSIAFQAAEFQHLTRVMRCKEGQYIELVNGRGILAQGRIVRIEKQQAIVSVTHCERSTQRKTEVILAQAICRSNRLSFILEKGTELGATQFWLFPAQNSEKEDFNENQLHRHQALLIAAMKQCGCLYLPQIVVKPALTKWQEPIAPRAYYGSTETQAPKFISQLQSNSDADQIIFFVGPEKGFTEQELQILQQKEVQGISLHTNILRTDTAGLAALSIIAQAMSVI